MNVYTFEFVDGLSDEDQEEIIYAPNEVTALERFTEKYPVQQYPDLQIDRINSSEEQEVA